MIAAWLGLSVFLQALLLGAHMDIGLGSSIQYYAGAACVAALVMVLWRARACLNPHLDMFLIMLASGGLGMFVAIPATSDPAHMACAMGSWRAYGWMFLFGLGPAIPLARCLRAALRNGYLMWALLIDAASMTGGMWLSGRTRGAHGEWAILTQHLTMLGGMTVGMLLGMWIRYAAFESRGHKSAFQAVRVALACTNRNPLHQGTPTKRRSERSF